MTSSSKQDMETSTEKPGEGLSLGIVTPMANERDSAEAFVRAVREVCQRYPFRSIQHFTVFDNVCKDGTVDIMRELEKDIPELQVVWAPENRCVVDAYMRGYQAALAAECDWILEMDAGFSHRPEDIPTLFDIMAKGYDCVFGVRFGKQGGNFDGNLKRRMISWGGTLLTNLLVGTRLDDMTSGFELFTRQALQTILEWGIQSKGPFFQAEIRAHAHRLNYAPAPIHYSSPSHNIGGSALEDALKCLWRLRAQRQNFQKRG